MRKKDLTSSSNLFHIIGPRLKIFSVDPLVPSLYSLSPCAILLYSLSLK